MKNGKKPMDVNRSDLSSYIATHRPADLTVSFQDYISCFTDKLYIDYSNDDFVLLYHKDYSDQYVKLYTDAYYSDVKVSMTTARRSISYLNVSLSPNGDYIIYKPLWSLHFCQEPHAGLDIGSNKVKEFTAIIYGVLNEHYGIKKVKLPMTGIVIPRELSDLFGYSLFAYQMEVDTKMLDVLSRLKTISSFVDKQNQLAVDKVTARKRAKVS
jgi:hypothetical protein